MRQIIKVIGSNTQVYRNEAGLDSEDVPAMRLSRKRLLLAVPCAGPTDPRYASCRVDYSCSCRNLNCGVKEGMENIFTCKNYAV